MENKLYRYLSFLLVKINAIDNSDIELYEYAIRVLLRGLINVITSIIIGVFFNMVKECLCILFVFFVLRKFTGGLHAKKYITCLICSLFLLALMLICVKLLLIYSITNIFLGLLIISIIAISILSPIENYNKKLSNREKKVYKCISITLSLSFGSLTQLMDISISYSISIAIIFTAFLLIFGKINMNIYNKMEERYGK